MGFSFETLKYPWIPILEFFGTAKTLYLLTSTFTFLLSIDREIKFTWNLQNILSTNL